MVNTGQRPTAIDHNGQYRTETNSNRSQWSIQDRDQQQWITMVNTGQRPTAIDHNGQYRTETNSNRSQWSIQDRDQQQ